MSTVEKRTAGKKVVKNATRIAAGVGGVVGAIPVPVPGLDVAVVAPVQVFMIRAICACYHLPECERQAVDPVGLLLATAVAKAGRKAATPAARAAAAAVSKKLAAANAAKLAPVIGSAVAAAISAGYAAATTKALGEAFIQLCEYAADHELKEIDRFLESAAGQFLIQLLTALGMAAILHTLIAEPMQEAKLRSLGAIHDAEVEDLRKEIDKLRERPPPPPRRAGASAS
ncbi:DUF697 domain-containing protein [Actinokineospora sp. NPDC004072]